MRRHFRIAPLAAAIATFAAIAPASASAATVVETESMTLGSGMANRIDHVAFLSNGTPATKQVTVDRLTKITVVGWAKLCDGAPIARIRVNNNLVASVTVTETTSASYAVAIDIPAGTYTLGIQFQNDLDRPGVCDRNLYVDSIVLSGSGSPPPPPPPPADSRPFPRLMMTDYLIDNAAEAQSIAKWDWIVTSGQYTTGNALWDEIKAANPNVKITPYIDGTESNGSQTSTARCQSPNQYDDPELPAAAEWTDNWWLKNYDGSFPNWPSQPGRRMPNPTTFAPTNASGERWYDHLANWIKRCYMGTPRGGSISGDGVLLDMVADSSIAGPWPIGDWRIVNSDGTGRIPKVDLDRSGARDYSEHGAQWANNQWGAALRDMTSKIRSAIGPNKLLIVNPGPGFNSVANGRSLELNNYTLNDRVINAFLQYEAGGTYGDSYQTLQSSYNTTHDDYRLMRNQLATALMAGVYFNHSCGADCNYTSLWWYDEYSVDLASGRATGDASRKGYLGLPIGPGVRASNGVWRRDFDKGIALVNTTGYTQTVNLGQTFRRIRGTQDPVTNSGATVTSIALAGSDAIVLLR